MSNDLARLGFAVDTSQLEAGEAALDKLVPAAKRAENATKAFNTAAAGITRSGSGAATGIQSFANAASQAATGSNGATKAALNASTAMGTVQRAAVAAASGMTGLSGSAFNLGRAMQQADAHVIAYQQHLASLPKVVNGAKSSLDRLGAAANDNINRLQATPGNIAAQFQDIGVTAAAGMSPMLIALQQGTQLSAAFAGGGLKNLGAAFANLLSPTSLLTIGIVGLVAALLQMVDWVKVGQAALRGMADVLEAAGPYVAAFGAAMLLWNLPTIASGVVTLTKAMWGLVASMTAAIGLPAILIAGLLAVVAGAVAFRDDLTKAIGVDIVGAAEKGMNYIVGFFVGGFNAVKKTWRLLPAAIGDAVIQTANQVDRAMTDLVNSGIEKINRLNAAIPKWLGGGDPNLIGKMSYHPLANPNAGAADNLNAIASDEIAKGINGQYFTKAVTWVSDQASKLGDKLRSIADGLGKTDEKLKKTRTAHPRTPKTPAEKFADILAGGERYITSKQADTAGLNLATEAALKLKHATDLTNAATQAGIPITKEYARAIDDLAARMAHADVVFEDAKTFKSIGDDFAKQMVAMRDAQNQIGMTADEMSRYKYETMWYGDQLSRLINATPEQIAQLQQMAHALAEGEIRTNHITEAVRQMKDALDFVRSGVKGFVSDLRNGLEQGKGFFNAFGNSVLNVLNKVIDKLTDLAIDSAIDGGKNGIGAGGFIKAVAGLFGGKPTANAKGNVFDGRDIVTTPTLFKFAKGTGLMGEAGPEAIMPLKRGRDGSLGVQVHGGAGSMPAPVISINQTFAISGAISSVDVAQSIRQSAEQTKDDLRRSIPGIIAEYQTSGAVV